MHVELEDSSYDERVVAEFMALLHRSSPHHRDRLLNAVHQAAAKLHQRGIELLAVTPSGSVMLYFMLKSLSAVHKMKKYSTKRSSRPYWKTSSRVYWSLVK